MKRLLTLAIALICFFPVLPARAKTSYVTLRSGSFVRLGSYMGEPIIWRCVGSDENGLLLVSTSILCFKAFSQDSSRWDISHLRAWLNSDRQSVDWGGLAPDEAHIDGNAYSDEAGFLCGFTAEELALIKQVRQKSAINGIDSKFADDGIRPHAYSSSGRFIKSVQNYTTALSLHTVDRVFCLNISQMETIMANYPSEFISAPTDSALEQSGNIKNAEGRSNSYYWLRDSLGNEEFGNAVRCVYPDGRILFADIDDSSIGVRPALYIAERIPVLEGNGYRGTPYAVSLEVVSSPVKKGSLSSNRSRPMARGRYSSLFSGEYVSMGEYNGSEIIWRCVDVNENGPLMLSESILCFKSFDSIGKHGEASRDHSGSNNWEQSNIRAWLNSSAPEGRVKWPCGNAPVSENCENTNGYSTEKGFLNSFAPEQLELIKPVCIKTVIPAFDKTDTTEGQEPLEFQRNVNNTANYAQAYKNTSEDLVFLLSIREANHIKANFGSFLTASPTAEAVNNNEALIEGLSSDRTTDWWLRDADTYILQNVRSVTPDGWIHSYRACKSANGIRPAFYLDMDKASFIAGNGTYDDPYKVSGHSFGDWELAQSPTCTEQGLKKRICSVCGQVKEVGVPVLGHDFDSGTIVSGNLFIGKKLRFTCKNCKKHYTKSKAGLWLPALGSALIIALIIFLKRKV